VTSILSKEQLLRSTLPVHVPIWDNFKNGTISKTTFLINMYICCQFSRWQSTTHRQNFGHWIKQHVFYQHNVRLKFNVEYSFKMLVDQNCEPKCPKISNTTHGWKRFPTLNYNCETIQNSWMTLNLLSNCSFSVSIWVRIFSHAGYKLVPSCARGIWENNWNPHALMGTSSYLAAWLKNTAFGDVKLAYD